jgi:hypothetical protein
MIQKQLMPVFLAIPSQYCLVISLRLDVSNYCDRGLVVHALEAAMNLLPTCTCKQLELIIMIRHRTNDRHKQLCGGSNSGHSDHLKFDTLLQACTSSNVCVTAAALLGFATIVCSTPTKKLTS